MRLIRVMCSGRVDLEFILRAFLKGQDGVFIGMFSIVFEIIDDIAIMAYDFSDNRSALPTH